MNTEIYYSMPDTNMKTEKVSSSQEYLAWIKATHDAVQEQIGSTFKYIYFKYYNLHLRNITLACAVGLNVGTDVIWL